MVKHIFRVAKIVILLAASIASTSSVLVGGFIGWWVLTLVALFAAYWVISPEDSWISRKSLQRKRETFEQVQSARPTWLAPKYSASSLGSIYFGLGVLLLAVYHSDLTGGRSGVFKFIVQMIGTTSLQLIFALVGTGLLFWSYELMLAIRLHIDASGQIRTK